MGKVVERHGGVVSFSWRHCCAAACVVARAVAIRLLTRRRTESALRGWRSPPRRAKMASVEGEARARVRARLKIVWQAAEKFAADDGWAIASYIGLTLLTSLFPFLIFVAASRRVPGLARPGA